MPGAEATLATGAVPKGYPWHAALWSKLTADPTRLPHALLLHGPVGLGKEAFARRFAAGLLCQRPSDGLMPCGRCHGCQLFAAGTHPDLKWVAPEEDRRGIVIEQMRALGAWLALAPHTASRKLAVIAPAEAMNLHAANGLLKQLEEPPPASLLLLVSHQPGRLPATVRSRCHKLGFTAPETGSALTWLGEEGSVAGAESLLALAEGAPLRALALARNDFANLRTGLLKDLDGLRAGRIDPLACASRWKGVGTELCLAWLAGFTADLIRGHMVGTDQEQPANPEAIEFLSYNKNTLNLNRLFVYFNVVNESINALKSPGLDELLMLEDMLIRWCYMMSERVRTQPENKAVT